MKKKNAIFGLILCTGLLFSVGSISKHTSANIGLAVANLVCDNEYVEAFCTSAGSAAGAWAGAKWGGKIGAFFGGPVGVCIGAGIGAL
ncbi:MAG: hypothetical protein FWE99_00265 [Bacteroidales bacterium]|nr:hypothetical protein [Bacteroidales bacterium]